MLTNFTGKRINLLYYMRVKMEFKEFEPRFKSAKTRFKLSAGLNLETFDTILSGTNHKWNQPYLNRGLNVNRRSNSLNSSIDRFFGSFARFYERLNRMISDFIGLFLKQQTGKNTKKRLSYPKQSKSYNLF